MLAMPAIIRPGILMPVRKVIEPDWFHVTGTTTITFLQREDLSDLIYNIEPFDTPIFMLGPYTKQTASFL